MIYCIVMLVCFVATYLLGVVIGRASVKMDREREDNGRLQRTK